MVQKPPKKGHGCLKIILLAIFVPPVILVGLFLFATRERWKSNDTVLRSYQPSAEIADIAETVTFTDEGKATFYRANPEFIAGEEFRSHCLKNNGIELALGCLVYHTPGKGPFSPPKIFLMNLDNPEYEDHKYTAAVHETMHLVYLRLSSDEKKSLNALLEQEFTTRQDDPHLTVNIGLIKEAGEEGDYLDELHSVFAVEYADLSPALEEYYRHYFSNRGVVVQLYQNGGLEKRLHRFEEVGYQASQLNSELLEMQSQLETYQSAGNIDAYNNLVGQFNAKVSQYNTLANESQRLYSEVDEFYKYFNPNYQAPQEVTSQ